MNLHDRLLAIASALDNQPHLHKLGALFDECVLIEAGEDSVYVFFHRGRVEKLVEGPSSRTPWRFALRTDPDALNRFWQQVPEPGFHDIFGLVKIGRAKIEGDVLALVKNLRFFKEFLALGRDGQA